MALAEIARKLPPVIAGPAVPYSSELGKIIYQPPDYQKYGKITFYNPSPDSMLEEISRVLKQEATSVSPKPPEKKRHVFNFIVAFADQHTSPLHSSFNIPHQGKEFLEKILDVSRQNQRPLTIPEQLEIAIKAFPDNNFTETIILLAVTSRAAARNYDSRIGIKVTPPEMEEWKTAVAPFGYNENTLNDPAGDTYHFWEGVLAGISVRIKREENTTLYEEITGRILETLYRQTAPLTNLIRYKICTHEGKPHDTIDILGLETGQALCYYL
jgi:hypothetical protein